MNCGSIGRMNSVAANRAVLGNQGGRSASRSRHHNAFAEIMQPHPVDGDTRH